MTLSDCDCSVMPSCIFTDISDGSNDVLIETACMSCQRAAWKLSLTVFQMQWSQQHYTQPGTSGVVIRGIAIGGCVFLLLNCWP